MLKHITSITLLFSQLFFFSCSTNAKSEVNSTSNNQNQGVTDKSNKIVTITAVGDMMLGTNYPNSSYLPPEDGKEILVNAIPYLKKGDIVFGNLEGVILTGNGTPKSCKNPSTCYIFKSPDHYIKHFLDAGFNLLSIANNHTGDFGQTGRDNTVRILQENKINFAGIIQYPSTTFEKDGIKYGFAAFAPNNGTVSINDIPNAVQIVKTLKKQCDIVIISFHGGAEGSSKNRITRSNEIFLNENRGNPYLFARSVIDAGADIVIGHGPHVPRAIDLYKGKFIAYSLGNFATYARFNLKGNSGYAPLLEIKLDGNGNFIEGQIHSFLQLGEGIPTLDENKSAALEIKRLTELDVPESQIQVDNNGKITLKK